jgi:tetratricopeptide (TPR) repeat protein
MSPTRDRPWLAPFCVALVAVAAHAGSLRGEFLEWDDALLVTDNPRVLEGGLSDIGHLVDPTADRENYGREYLPLRDLSNRLDRALFGLDPVGYHLGNVVLFGLAAAALFGVLRVLTGERRAALLGALIFAVHPAATESVACIAHRKDMLMAALVLGAWLAWLKERRWLATVLFAGAVLSKLPAVVFPALALLGDVALGRVLDRRRLAGLASLGGLAAAALVMSIAVSPGLETATWHGGTPLANLLSVGAAFLESVRLLVLPVGLRVGRVNEELIRTSPDVASLAGLAILAGLVVLGVVALRRARASRGWCVTAVAALGLVVVQFPYLQIRPFWVLFAERYLVLALVPLSLAAGWLLSRRPLLRWGAVAVALLMVVSTWRREAQWRDTETLFADAIRKDPRSYIALDKMGRLRYAAGRHGEAVPLFTCAIAAAEGYRSLGQRVLEEILTTSRLDLVNCHIETGRLDLARGAAEEFGRRHPDVWLARFTLGRVAHLDGRVEEAEKLYLESIETAKRTGVGPAMAHYNLALIHRDRDGEGDERVRERLRRAVEADLDLLAAWVELARICRVTERWREAAEAYAGAVRADPENPAWLLERADLLERRLNRPLEAARLRERAARLK